MSVPEGCGRTHGEEEAKASNVKMTTVSITDLAFFVLNYARVHGLKYYIRGHEKDLDDPSKTCIRI